MSIHVDAVGARKADLAAIHIAAAQLGMDDDEYRDLLSTLCQVRSSGQLDRAGRKRFIDHLAKCLRERGVKPGGSLGYNPQKLSAAARKVWSLWMALADVGIVRSRSSGALNRYIKRQTGVDRLEWLNSHQTGLVIESLKRWHERHVQPAAVASSAPSGQLQTGSDT